GVLRVDVHAAVVAALSIRDPLVGRVHLAPVRAAIIGAIESGVLDQVHALRVGVHRDRNRGAARQCGKPAALDLLPCQSVIGRLVQRGAASRARSARARYPGGDVMPYSGCEYDVGLIVRACELLNTSGVVDVQSLRPRPAAVGAAEYASHVGMGMDVALS